MNVAIHSNKMSNFDIDKRIKLWIKIQCDLLQKCNMCRTNMSLLPCRLAVFAPWFVAFWPQISFLLYCWKMIQIALKVGVCGLSLPIEFLPIHSYLHPSQYGFATPCFRAKNSFVPTTLSYSSWEICWDIINNHFASSMACRLRSTYINFKVHRSFHFINSSNALISCSVASSSLANSSFEPHFGNPFRHLIAICIWISSIV